MDIKENANIFSYQGFIGRRNYIANCCILVVICVIFHFLRIIFGIENKFVLFLTVISAIFVAVFSIFNDKKRICDIAERESLPFFVILIISVFTFLSDFIAIFAKNYTVLRIITSNLSFIYLILLFCLKGKFSARIPKSEIAKFNWGAFFGTWIWGLFNKTYVTLWAIPLGIIAFPYLSILFGLKGNEWAYENKKYNSVEEFHKSQKNQATFWSIFTPVIAFFILVITGLLFVVGIVAMHKNNAIDPSRPTFTDLLMDSSFNRYFESYKFKNGECNFYMNPAKWKWLSDSERMQIVKFARSYSKYKAQKDLSMASYYKFDVYKLKIYSSYNGELLFRFNTSKLDNAKSAGDIIKGAFSLYDFNRNPKLPPKK